MSAAYSNPDASTNQRRRLSSALQADSSEKPQLGAQQQNSFRSNGYCLLPDYLSLAELETLQSVCNELMNEPVEGDDAGKNIHKLGKGESRRFLRHRHETLPQLAEFVLGHSMKELSTHFLQDESYLFNEQFVVKGAQTGASFAWHQDSGYVGFDHKPYLTVWIALDDTRVENGALYLLPRDLERQNVIDAHVWDDQGSELVGYSGSECGIVAEVTAGTVVVFSSLTLHRSSTNVTDKPRRAYLAQYSSEPLLDPATGKLKRFATRL